MELKNNIFQAYYEARKNKRHTRNQLLFEIEYESKLLALYSEIKNGTYKVGKSIAFIVEEPVKREIFAADFRDRIVHHLLFMYINPILESAFIEDSYSCRKGRGTLFGIQRAYEYLSKVSHNFTRNAYILKLDIQGYFMNINKNILLSKLRTTITSQKYIESRRKISDDNLDGILDYDAMFNLLELVIKNDPTNNCFIKGSLSDWEELPESKSLFKASPHCGLPIGNLTSQLFSNVYLNDFDHYIKESLGLEYYGRYVDDFYIFHSDKNYLKYILSECKKFLLQEGLEIHPKKIYLQHYAKGFQFLGVYIKPHRIYIGKRTAGKFKKMIYAYKKQTEENQHYSAEDLRKMRAVLNSYLGLMSHYKTYRLRYNLIFKKAPNVFDQYGFFSNDLKKIVLYPNLN
ncbi:reverse transcriptase/maturase family protein [Chryseobacterium sp.]|uniref:reverse transcriptase/maturase family protein n=1 Tax=Chryseobacterium sp. TaxID=1871047 RepID=UPI0035B29546